jgi:ABC-2 type transport system ATP-binding protein
MSSIIETKGLTKIFRGNVRAVDDVSFDVRKGEVFGLLGPNGAGKSTLLRMLCTLTRPTSGKAIVAGLDVVEDANEVRKHIGLVAEKMIMYNHLTAYENLMLFGKLHDVPSELLDRRIDELLDLVQMSKWRNTRVGDFSTGMRQKVNVIRGLIHMPEILFLDEPTLGLDPKSSLEIRELTTRLSKEQGITVILTTHYLDEADVLSHRVGIMDHGRVVALGTPAELKRRVSESDAVVLQLNVSNLNVDLISRIQSLDCVAKVLAKNPTELKIYASGEEAVDAVIDVVRSGGGRISFIKNLEPTLEDVFIRITGREVEEGVVREAAPVPRRWAGRF